MDTPVPGTGSQWLLNLKPIMLGYNLPMDESIGSVWVGNKLTRTQGAKTGLTNRSWKRIMQIRTEKECAEILRPQNSRGKDQEELIAND